jgi:transcription antitermination protein NusB
VATRREARERALGLVYESEQRGEQVRSIIDALPLSPDPYAVELAVGTETHRPEIDELLGTYAEHWTVERMPAVDRSLLRIATFELGWCPDIPTAVIVTEAVELAKQYSTKDSGRFVNGLLSRLASELRAA